ncbi:MAG: hypothetical protein NZ874_04610 [Fimbriimonadales bacterium]|nr:hypothetical protein [Fimbriimonadales bacterium]
MRAGFRSVGVSPTSVAWIVVSKPSTDTTVRATRARRRGRRRYRVIPFVPS